MDKQGNETHMVDRTVVENRVGQSYGPDASAAPDGSRRLRDRIRDLFDADLTRRDEERSHDPKALRTMAFVVAAVWVLFLFVHLSQGRVWSCLVAICPSIVLSFVVVWLARPGAAPARIRMLNHFTLSASGSSSISAMMIVDRMPNIWFA